MYEMRLSRCWRTMAGYSNCIFIYPDLLKQQNHRDEDQIMLPRFLRLQRTEWRPVSQGHHDSRLQFSQEIHLPQCQRTWHTQVWDTGELWKRSIGHANAYNLGHDYCSYLRQILPWERWVTSIRDLTVHFLQLNLKKPLTIQSERVY